MAAGPPPAMTRCIVRTYGRARCAPSGCAHHRTAGFPHAEPVVAAEGARRFRFETSSMPLNVLIIGGGPAALEAALALNRLAGERVSTTLLAPEANLTYRPLSVLAPFAAGEATTYPLEQMASDARFTHVRGRLDHVDPVAHVVTTIT